MNRFFNKNKESDKPRDFILFNKDNSTENVSGSETGVSQDTANIDVKEISAQLNNIEKRKRVSLKPIEWFKKHRTVTAVICGVLVVLIVASIAVGVIKLSDPLYKYSQVAAEKMPITRTIDVSGTLTSGDRYEITSLVTGKVITADKEVGDVVEKNDILYKLDDTDAKLIVERAQNEVQKAGDGMGTNTMYRVTATEAGEIHSVNVTTGGMVNVGTQIATIKRADGSIVAVNSNEAGKVAVVSVRTGQSLSIGQIIASIVPTNPINFTTDRRSAEIDLQAAQRQLENYSIKSPIDGIIVEKYVKEGDNIGTLDKIMMVVLDTHTLKFSFKADEKQVREFEKGQSVTVKSESVPDGEFEGEVSAVSTEGKVAEDGRLMFDVTVNVTEVGELKAGMNVTATVTIDSKKNVLAIPQKALMEMNGETALVFVKKDSASENADEDLTDSLENELEYPHIKVPKGCLLAKVEYGLSDGNNVQILSGLKLADIVVYDEEREVTFILPAKIDDDDEFEVDDDFEPDFSVEQEENDEDLNAEVENEIERLLQDM